MIRRARTAGIPVASVLAGLVGALAAAGPLLAQDSHYWTEQYGTRASLLAGALIGSVADVSAAYYNPGAAALYQDAGFVLSGTAYRDETIVIEDGAGEGRDLATGSQKPLPTLFATPIRFGFLGRHVILYSVLTRQLFDASVTSQFVGTGDVLPQPGDELVADGYNGEVGLRDTWAGLTWAYPVTESIGVGLTQFLSIRSHRLSSTVLLQGATPAGEVGIGTRIRSRSYTHYRTLTKLGAMAESGPYSLGVTVTTPSISLGGEGSATFNSSLAGVDLDGDGADDSYLAANVQQGLETEFRSGWAVGAGAGLRFGDSRLHLSAEWFEGVDKHWVMNAEEFTAQAGGGTYDNDATAQFASVLNWGVGIEQRVRDVTVFAGLASDRSAAVPDRDLDTSVTLTTYDLLRYSGGASFSVGPADLMLGLGYASGSQPFSRLADLEEDTTGRDDVTFRYTQWTVVLGFELTTRSGGDEPES